MTYKQPYVELHNQDCLEGIKAIPDGSIDVILTDPPYLYLKNQKLEREFDEMALFTQWKRVLKKGGFIVLFGRGTSFYRWNTRLADLGFEFKEEIVWDKRRATSPVLPIHRCHETVSIHCLGKGSINKVRVPYLEMKAEDISSIRADIKRLSSVLKNENDFVNVTEYLKSKEIPKSKNKNNSSGSTVGSGSLNVMSVTPIYMRSINEGIVEKSIIDVTSDIKRIHPTQKPVRLLERLLALVSKEGDIVLDCFSGSGSTAAACINTQRKFIGFEIDEEYYTSSVERLKAHEPQLTMF